VVELSLALSLGLEGSRQPGDSAARCRCRYRYRCLAGRRYGRSTHVKTHRLPRAHLLVECRSRGAEREREWVGIVLVWSRWRACLIVALHRSYHHQHLPPLTLTHNHPHSHSPSHSHSLTHTLVPFDRSRTYASLGYSRSCHHRHHHHSALLGVARWCSPSWRATATVVVRATATIARTLPALPAARRRCVAPTMRCSASRARPARPRSRPRTTHRRASSIPTATRATRRKPRAASRSCTRPTRRSATPSRAPPTTARRTCARTSSRAPRSSTSSTR